jgi:hypothetical protein
MLRSHLYHYVLSQVVRVFSVQLPVVLIRCLMMFVRILSKKQPTVVLRQCCQLMNRTMLAGPVAIVLCLMNCDEQWMWIKTGNLIDHDVHSRLAKSLYIAAGSSSYLIISADRMAAAIVWKDVGAYTEPVVQGARCPIAVVMAGDWHMQRTDAQPLRSYRMAGRVLRKHLSQSGVRRLLLSSTMATELGLPWWWFARRLCGARGGRKHLAVQYNFMSRRVQFRKGTISNHTHRPLA